LPILSTPFAGPHCSTLIGPRKRVNTNTTPRKGGRRPPKADEATKRLLEEDIRRRPAATVAERRHFLMSFAGKPLSEPTLRRLMKRMGFSRKKGLWGRWNETNGKEPPGR
jgi:transposase